LLLFFYKKRTAKVLFFKKNYKNIKKITINPTGWGAGQPGFPCDIKTIYIKFIIKKWIESHK